MHTLNAYLRAHLCYASYTIRPRRAELLAASGLAPLYMCRHFSTGAAAPTAPRSSSTTANALAQPQFSRVYGNTRSAHRVVAGAHRDRFMTALRAKHMHASAAVLVHVCRPRRAVVAYRGKAAPEPGYIGRRVRKRIS
jgi:hypothetical protein